MLTEDYIDSLERLEKLCFDEPWTKGMFLGDLRNENTVYFAAVNGENDVVGYAGMWIAVDEGQITNVAVHPDYRRRGIASGLLDKLCGICIKNDLHSITLEVREGNTGAVSLYSHLGFCKVGIRKNYYKNPTENAILMTKSFGMERND